MNQNRNHYNQHIFAVEKCVYYCSIKIRASGLFEKLLESIFYFLLVVEAFYLPKVVEMFEEV